MARGPARAPSQNAYKGALGKTQTAIVHVSSARGDLIASTVYTTVDAVTDPELVERMFVDSLNTHRMDGSDAVKIDVPVIYHDPATEMLVLVLGDAQRHRELDERIRLLERIRADDAPVPAYVKDFAVVFGAVGLRKHLEAKVQQALAVRESTKETDRRRAELAAREAELDRARKELEHSQHELDLAKAEHQHAEAELERNRKELDRMRAEARARVIAAVSEPATTVAPAPDRDDIITKPIGRQEVEQIEATSQAEQPKKRVDTDVGTEAATRYDPSPNGARPPSTGFDEEKTGDDVKKITSVEADEEPTGNTGIPPGSDPVT